MVWEDRRYFGDGPAEFVDSHRVLFATILAGVCAKNLNENSTFYTLVFRHSKVTSYNVEKALELVKIAVCGTVERVYFFVFLNDLEGIIRNACYRLIRSRYILFYFNIIFSYFILLKMIEYVRTGWGGYF